jgi:glucose-1-phosphate thymidylyltransferase
VRDFGTSDLDASLLLTAVEDPTQYGVALVDEQKKVIVCLVEKPKVPPSNLSIVGIYGLTPVIFRAIDEIKPSWRGELEITDALHWLIENGYRVGYRLVEGWWKDTGKPEDILEANRLVLDGMPSSVLGTVENSMVRGDVVIGEGSRVCAGSVVRGPVIVGRGCTIEGSSIGPFASIGDNAVIQNSEVEDSIVMEGSCISNAGKISQSLIGRNVLVESDPAHPPKRRFILGDSSQVWL